MKQKTKFKQTEIGKIPEDWEVKPLNEISKVIDSCHKTPKYSIDGIPMVRVTDICGGFLDLKNTLRVTEEIYEEFTKNHKPLKGDIVLSRVGTYGISSFVNKKEKFCLGQNTVIIHPEIENYYLFSALNSPIVKNQIEMQVGGSTQKTIRLKDIRELKFPLPQNEEITLLCNFLYSLDAKMELNNKMNKTLEAIGQAIFKRWFVDFEFSDGKKLGDILSLEYGKGLHVTKRKAGKIPIYGSGGFMGFHNEYLVEGPGIIVGRAGCPGKIHLLKENFWPVDSTFHVKTKKEYFFYVYYLLKKMDLGFLNSGSAVPGLNRNTAYEQKIKFPSEEKIIEFNKICEYLFNKIWDNESQSQTLSQIKDSLLPKLMSGEVGVK